MYIPKGARWVTVRSVADRGQISASAAEVYDEFFVPALFGAWAGRMLDFGEVDEGMRVLDVACGTGVLAIEAKRRVGSHGAVAAVDINPGMLSVARDKGTRVDWREAAAESLPFDAGSFDAVLSQFGLMFFSDRSRALSEMWRVCRPGGRVVAAVWASLDQTPGYFRVVGLLRRLFGDATAKLLEAPYALGDGIELRRLFTSARVAPVSIELVAGEAWFPSVRSWMHTDVRGWTLEGEIDEPQFELLVSEAERELGDLADDDGAVRFAHPALIARATKPSSPS